MADQAGAVLVFAPAPSLTITFERRGDRSDLHLHAGGQGFWIARMVAALGVPVTLAASFGGESGAVLRPLIEREGVAVRGTEMEAANPAQVHDRRTGDLQLVMETPVAALPRHDLDVLYGATLVAGLAATVCVLGGPAHTDAVPPETYRRLSADLRANGRAVVADLAGAPLAEVLEGGVDVLKVSDEELVRDGRAASGEDGEVVAAMRSLRDAGADSVIVSRADRPALAAWDDDVVEIVSPRVQPFDAHGAGDAMTAGIAASVARGDDFGTAVRVGAAAGALNVTRRGLATGHRVQIEEMAGHIEMRPHSVLVAHAVEEVPETTTVEELAARARPT